MEERETIGTRLNELRGQTGKSCEQVVKELAVHQQYSLSRESLDKYERDLRIPNGKAVVALADYYGVTTDYLLGYSPIKLSVDQLQITTNILGLSIDATKRLVELCHMKGSRCGDLLGEILESPAFPKLLEVMVDSQNGIDRSRRLLEESREAARRKGKDPHPLDSMILKGNGTDMAEMYVLRSMRQVGELLREVLGYNDLIQEANNG